MGISDVLAGNERWYIETGHVLAVLGGMPDNSVQCVVTSPPYWGLRDYNLPPVVWNGDEMVHCSCGVTMRYQEGLECPVCGHYKWTPVDCEHEWTTETRKGMSGGTASEKVSIKGQDNFQIVPDTKHAFCLKCGAWKGSLGLEPDIASYVRHLIQVFREVKRVLRSDGTCWLNMGDSYMGSGRGPTGATGIGNQEQRQGFHSPGVVVSDDLKPKDLCLIPSRVALALQQDGWWVRSCIIWSKLNPMPESVKDRPTTSHEYIYLLTKSARYYWDQEAVKQKAIHEGRTVKASNPQTAKNAQKGKYGATAIGFTQHDTIVRGRNLRSVWEIATKPFSGAHFATMPPKLVERCILAGTSERGCCPECGRPWERMIEKTESVDALAKGSRFDMGKTATHQQGRAQAGERFTNRTLGWQSTCDCAITDEWGERSPYQPMPAIVLDCFSGAGTTILVALRLGRRAIGIELSEPYVQMSEKRIRADARAMNRRMM